MASVFSDDFESGDLTSWTNQDEETGNTIEASTDAVKNDTYGLKVVQGGTNDDCHTNKDLGIGNEESQLWSVFWFRLNGDVASGGHVAFITFSNTQTGSLGGLIGIRTTGSFTNRLHVWDGASWDADDGTNGTFDFTSDTWYGIRTRVKVETSDGNDDGEVEVQTSTDGESFTQRFERTDLDIGSADLRWIRAGTDFGTASLEFWYDDLDVDNASFPTLNTGAGGISIPVVMHHRQNQGMS